MTEELIGQSIEGRYSIEKKIGEGGMGEVYRALDMVAGDYVAIKILKEDLLNKSTYLRRFQREIRSGSLMHHPYIVKVLSDGYFENLPYLIMEYVEGMNLRKWAKNKKNALPLILEKFEMICSALTCAHNQGIVHRDLKPENVLVDYKGKVKLMDFGLARKIEETTMITSPGTFVGTVVYTSPEQASGKEVDHRCDIYALGVMLYELILGILPFKGDDPIAVLFQHIHNKPAPCRDVDPAIPQELDRLISQILEKDPDKRPQSAEEVAKRLRVIRFSMLEQPAMIKEPEGGRRFDPLEGDTFLAETPKARIPIQGNVRSTFMMLELTNFSRVAEIIDARTILEFLTSFEMTVKRIIQKYKGKVVQFGGSKAFFIFRSYDDENFALNAVMSAKDIMGTIARFREESWAKSFRKIDLDIGMATEEIPAEVTLDEHLNSLVSKTRYYRVTNLIQNQSKSLKGDSILVCGDTFALVREKVKGSQFKRLSVGGRKDPLFVYAVDWN